MPVKLTREEFIRRSTLARNGIEYDYTNSVFKGTVGNIEVICNKGHVFKQRVNDHLRGALCQYCTGKFMNTETFIEKALQIHGENFIYDEVVYVKSNKKVIISCRFGHRFEQRPNDHLSGKGCRQCADKANGLNQMMSQEDFIAKSKSNHVLEYDYSDMVYKGIDKQINLTCPFGHKFSQQAYNHSIGVGCPICTKSGYRKNLAGYIYILSNGNITKIGITNKKPEVRLRYINRGFFGFKIIYSQFYEDGSIPLAVETSVLWFMRLTYKSIDEKFNGSTECFYDVNRDELIRFVDGSGKNLERIGNDSN